MRRTLASVVTAAAVGLISTACAPAVQNITTPSAASVAAIPDQATIVIVQPTTAFQSVNILDARGQLLGQLNQRSRTVVRVPPGPVRFYAIPEKRADWGDRIDGTVLAGRIYYATISVRRGGMSFLALTPRSRDNRWAQREQYVARTPMVEVDPSKVAIAIREIGDPAPMLQKIDAHIEALGAAHRAERVIEPADGL
jgi:hypothetical protein